MARQLFGHHILVEYMNCLPKLDLSIEIYYLVEQNFIYLLATGDGKHGTNYIPNNIL